MSKLEEDYAKLALHRRSLQALAESEGWQIFLAYLLQAEQPLQAAILQQIKSQEEVYLREFQKGHLYALRALQAYPEAFISDINSAMEAMQVQLAEETVEDNDDVPTEAEDLGPGWDRDGSGADGGGDGDLDGGNEVP